MIDSFLKYLQFEKRVSQHTVLAYESDLDQFKRFLKDTFELDQRAQAHHGLIRSWIVQLVESGIEESSVNRKIACLRSYYKFLMRQEVIEKDPMMKIKILKAKKQLPSFVKETDMVNVLDHQEFANDLEGWRDRLMLELFYATGIRLSELINLKESQVNLRQQTIKVLGKRNKERVIPFPASIVSIFEGYRTVRIEK